MSTASDKRTYTSQSPRIAPSFLADARHRHVSRYRPEISDSPRLRVASLQLPGSSSYLPGPPTHLPGPSCARTFARPSSFHSLYRDRSHVLHRRRTPCTCGKPATPFKDPDTPFVDPDAARTPRRTRGFRALYGRSSFIIRESGHRSTTMRSSICGDRVFEPSVQVFEPGAQSPRVTRGALLRAPEIQSR